MSKGLGGLRRHMLPTDDAFNCRAWAEMNNGSRFILGVPGGCATITTRQAIFEWLFFDKALEKIALLGNDDNEL
jgi:hypothetical protein